MCNANEENRQMRRRQTHTHTKCDLSNTNYYEWMKEKKKNMKKRLKTICIALHWTSCYKVNIFFGK